MLLVLQAAVWHRSDAARPTGSCLAPVLCCSSHRQLFGTGLMLLVPQAAVWHHPTYHTVVGRLAASRETRMSEKGADCAALSLPHVFSCSTSRKHAAATRFETPADNSLKGTDSFWVCPSIRVTREHAWKVRKARHLLWSVHY